jgi:hypothetical protein
MRRVPITYDRFRFQSTLLSVLFFCSIQGLAQTTLLSLTANNTSACPSSGKLPAHCQKRFSGDTDSRPQVATPQFDAPAGNVSDEDPHSYLTQGATTKIYVNIMAGFCSESDSGYCHNNVQTGYSSNDKKTVATQAEDIKRRHFDGAIISWEGAGTVEDSAALKLQTYIDAKHCKGSQQCDLSYLIMYDGPSTGYRVASTDIDGTTGASCSGVRGADFENCVIAHIRNDMCYMNGRHWGNEAYLKVNGQPVVQVFPDEGVIPAVGPAPSWVDVWVHIQEWNNALATNCGKAPYDAENGVPLLIFENTAGFSHQSSSGAYYWLKPEGTEPDRDQFVANIGPESGKSTLDSFYLTALQHEDGLVWGGAFKGFNSSKSAWGVNRIMDPECGQVWLKSLTESNQYYSSDALPYLQIATWNDYNEGTEIESGIDNCYTVSGRVDGLNLVWNLTPTNATYASLSTVSHVEIYDSRNGRDLTLVGSVPTGASGTYSLKELPAGDHALFVRMVGKNSILNRISLPIAFVQRAGNPLLPRSTANR